MNIYSSLSKKTIRFISFISLLILIISNIITISKNVYDKLVIFKLCQNSFVIVLTVILIIYPTKLIIISIIAFQYSFVSLYYTNIDIMALLMFILGYTVLLFQGFYKEKKTLKIMLSILPLVILYLSELRFGIKDFIYSSIYRFGYIFVISLIIIFLNFYINNNSRTDEKVLNIANYKGLKKRDAEWLQYIQRKEKYDCIAIEYQMSIGSVKNRLKVIFDTLEVGDKTGFLNIYSDYEIIFIQTKEL